jgi:methionine-rich copper-binding protein CopC
MKKSFTLFCMFLFVILSGNLYSQSEGLKVEKERTATKAYNVDLSLELLSPEPYLNSPGKIPEPDALLNNKILEGDVVYRFNLTNQGTDTITEDSIAYGYFKMDDEFNPVDTVIEYYKVNDSIFPGMQLTIEPGSLNLEGGSIYQIGGWSFKPNNTLDENPLNDTTGAEFYVYATGQLVEDFSGTIFPPPDWNDGEGWMNEEIYVRRLKMHTGSSPVILQDKNDPPADLITPKLKVGSDHHTLHFDLAGENNVAAVDKESTGNSFLLIKYTQDLSSGWNTLKTLDMSKEGDVPKRQMLDLSSLIGGSYYFSFHTYSTYNGNDFLGKSGVAIDNVIGPVVENLNTNDLAVKEFDFLREFIKAEDDAIDIIAEIENNGTETQANVSIDYLLDGQVIGSGVIGEIGYRERAKDTLKCIVTEASGKHQFEVQLSKDDDSTNNHESFETVFYDNTMNIFGFENGSLPSNWLPERSSGGVSWNVGSIPEETSRYEGNYSAYVESGRKTIEEKAGPYEDLRLTTEKIYLGGNMDKFYFAASRYHFLDVYSEAESSLKLQYSTSRSGPWYDVTEEIILTEEMKIYEADLSGIPVGEYYFAFSASSEYYNADRDLAGMVCLDFVHTPLFAKPTVKTLEPSDGQTNVSETGYVAAIFDSKLDSIDFSGISIKNSSGELVSGVYGKINIPYKKGIGVSSGDALQLFHDPFQKRGEVYTATIPANSVKREGGKHGNDTIKWSFRTTLPKPEPELLYPDTMAQGIPIDAELYIKFNQRVSKGPGLIYLIGAKADTIEVYSWDMGPAYRVLSIDHANFMYDDTVKVIVKMNAVKNEDFIYNTDTSWTFYTMSADLPVADSLTPGNNKRAAALDNNVEIHFSEPVTENDLSGISISGKNSGNVSGVSATLANDSVVTITHDPFPENNELYTVTIPEGAVTSIDGGVNNKKINWNFTTVMKTPEVITLIPDSEAVKIDEEIKRISLEFDQLIDDSQVDLDTVFTVMNSKQEKVQTGYAYIDMLNQKKVSIYIDEKLDNQETYTVTMKPNSVHNIDSVFNETVTWQFNTIMAPPKVVDYIPDFESVDVPLDAGVSVTFDQDLTVKSLDRVSIMSDKKGAVPGLNAVLNSDKRTVEISHAGFFTENNDIYTVKIPYNSLENADGVENNELTYTFSTIATYNLTFDINDGNGPLADVSIMLDTIHKTTDTTGKTMYTDIIDGTEFNYSIAKSGFDTIRGYVIVDDHKVVSYSMQVMDTTYDITFSVDDGTNPLSDAIIEINNQTKNTDSNGKAVYSLLEGNEFDYTITKTGFKTITGQVVTDNNKIINHSMDVSTGLSKTLEQRLNIYPNPASDMLHLDWNDDINKAEVLLTNITGKTVLTKKLFDRNNSVEISNLPKGIYFITIKQGKDSYISKLLIK